jgi:hypothetical protein
VSLGYVAWLRRGHRASRQGELAAPSRAATAPRTQEETEEVTGR